MRSARGEQSAPTGRYMPALDGLRALAIAGVFAYHLGAGWAAGGYLGVDLFFVLSGFLITSLLVEEWAGTGTISLRKFWARRARRLLPALIVMLVLVSVWVEFDRGRLPVDLQQFRGDAFATLFYVANWHLIVVHQSYFDQFALPSPLKHTWSLAIEEQFYLVWPLVILGLLRVTTTRFARRARRTGPISNGIVETAKTIPARRWRSAGIALTASGALASAAWTAYLSIRGASVNRLYYGTDTRALDILVGATLAMAVAAAPQPSASNRRLLHIAAPVGVVVLALCWWLAGGTGGAPPSWMFEGGFLVCALAAAVVIADVRQAHLGPMGKMLGLAPLRYVGKISYGLYLWHWPVIVEINSEMTGLSGLALTATRIAVTGALALASYYLVEQPIRRGVMRSWPSPLRVGIVPLAIGAASTAVVLATLPAAAATRTVPRAAAVATSSGVQGAGGTVGRRIAIGFRPSPSRRLRVLLVGDSVMLSESPAVQALLDSTGAVVVTNHAQWGWGLSVVHDWKSQVSGWIAQSHPQLVIAMWSWDNTVLAEHPVRYRAELEAFVRTLLAPGDGVRGIVFEQYPSPGPNPILTAANPKFEAEQIALDTRWDKLSASLTAVFPGSVMYFPLEPAILFHGRYTSWLPPENDPSAPHRSWVRVRFLDDVHLCPSGAARYAAALYADLSSLYALPAPAPRWWSGLWTQNAIAYGSPTQTSCPADHP